MIGYDFLREQMVDTQLRTDGISTPQYVNAFLKVEREKYFDSPLKPFAYTDSELEIKKEGKSRTEMTPACFAHALKALDLDADDTALCVAPATGYGPAVMSELCTVVTVFDDDQQHLDDLSAIWINEEIATIFTQQGDLEQGPKDEAKYEAILICGMIEKEPIGFFEKLQEGGRLVCILSDSGNGAAGLMVYLKHGNTFKAQKIRSLSCYKAHFLNQEIEFKFAM